MIFQATLQLRFASGTTLAYLIEKAFVPFVDAVSVQSVMSKGNQCYEVTLSTPDMFATVNLNFPGGTSMFLRPQDYLLQQNSVVAHGDVAVMIH
ncbi:aspartic proteinase-like protein 2 [Tanacetum coccineum]